MFKPPNYTQAPNEFFDDIAKTLKEGELRVLLVIMRQTFGWQKKWDRISLSQLMQKTGMERKAVNNSLKSLIEKKLIQKHKDGEMDNGNCWYTLEVEKAQNEEEIPDNEADIIDDSNKSYWYPKDTRGSILKIPTKETITKEIISPIVPKGDISIPRKKIKEEKTSRSERVFISKSQHDNLLKKANGNEGLVSCWYEKLSEWKIGKEIFGGNNDYKSILNWVIDSVNTSQKADSSKVESSAANKSLAEKIRLKYPSIISKREIRLGENYIEFPNCVADPEIKFTDHAFRERVLKNLMKMNLNIQGL